MAHKILFVDDDSNLLEAFKRQLGKQFKTDVVLNGREGLDAVKIWGPYSIVISDYSMPGMDGVQFLSRVRVIAPETVRILLTGHADLETAIQAVNEVNIFRLLTKPCPSGVLGKALLDGKKYYETITAERALLEDTLKASVKVLSDVLSLVKPEVYGRVSRLVLYVRKISRELGDPDPWQAETAAMVSLLGFIALPDSMVQRVSKGIELTTQEMEIFSQHPAVASELLSNIPRMEEVARIIAYQEKHFDGSGFPTDSVKGEQIPLGARILKLVLDFDALTTSDIPKGEAVTELQRRKGWYDPTVLSALGPVLGDEAQYAVRKTSVNGLKENMILVEDVFTRDRRTKLLGRGQEISTTLIEYLRKYKETVGITEPIKVIVPIKIR